MPADEEERQLRITALRNAEAALIARERADQELRDAKAQLELNYEELQLQREWFAVTLSNIGDAVITTDARGIVTFLNPVGQDLVGESPLRPEPPMRHTPRRHH